MLTGMPYGDDDEVSSSSCGVLLEIPVDHTVVSLAHITAHLNNEEGQLEQELIDAQRRLSLARRRSDDLRCELASIRGRISAGDVQITPAAQETHHTNRIPALECDLHDSNGDLSSVSLSCSSLPLDKKEHSGKNERTVFPNHASSSAGPFPPESPFHADGFSLW